MRLDWRLSKATGWYAFEISAGPKWRYVVNREECVVRSGDQRYVMNEVRTTEAQAPRPTRAIRPTRRKPIAMGHQGRRAERIEPIVASTFCL